MVTKWTDMILLIGVLIETKNVLNLTHITAGRKSERGINFPVQHLNVDH